MTSSLVDQALHPLAVLGPCEPAGGLMGYCATNYEMLCIVLGRPHEQNGDKVNVLWSFACNNGTVFTVYDWKNPVTPMGEYAWHIGGNGDALAAFERFTGMKTKPFEP